MSYFRDVLASEYPFHITSISRNGSKFGKIWKEGELFQTLFKVIKTIETPYSALSGHESTIYYPAIKARLVTKQV